MCESDNGNPGAVHKPNCIEIEAVALGCLPYAYHEVALHVEH